MKGSNVKCILITFADNTMFSGVVATFEGQDAIQRDLKNLERWAHGYLMRCNEAKYKVLHLGWVSPQYQYRLGDEQIKSRLRRTWGCRWLRGWT